MLQEKTVFVLGAGASAEVGLPTGSKLTDKIAEVVPDNFDFTFTGGHAQFGMALQLQMQLANVRLANDHLSACQLIKRAMPQSLSIDDFIHIHRDNKFIAECGKLAIACVILAEEAGSDLSVKRFE